MKDGGWGRVQHYGAAHRTRNHTYNTLCGLRIVWRLEFEPITDHRCRRCERIAAKAMA